MHDIGKVAIPDAVLLKNGKLTDVEFDEMKQHVLTGQNVLRETIAKIPFNGVISRNWDEYMRISSREI
ncbi:hypothetical protein [Desulfosporosinus fructosivorans]|uniref:hypothetical protein n=1 Tax=Desulfosporosinus fructosivorans TaxID=2018669 RepID=UPI0030846C1E